MAGAQRYSVVVSKEHLKFAASHFIPFPGFREPLHGHDYQVSVAVEADLGRIAPAHSSDKRPS